MKPGPLHLAALISSFLFILSGCKEAASTDEIVEETVVEEAIEEVAAPELSFDSLNAKVSYGIGFQFGMNLARQSDTELDQDALYAGIEDGLADAELRVSETELQAAFAEMQEQIRAKTAAIAPENLAAAEAFLAQNKEREGVITTESGLQYEIISAAEGPLPTAGDTVEVHYHGTLIDGTVFDSSVDRGETVSFPVQGVIPGWIEALQLMPVGSKWRLFIHPSLAYGERATGSIPPNSALIFEVELIGIAGQ